MSDSKPVNIIGDDVKKDFSNAEIVKRYVQYRPSPPSSIISTVLHFLTQQQQQQQHGQQQHEHEVKDIKGEEGSSLCVDVGCGSGQNTHLYADHFKHVVGVDVSVDQLDAARVTNTRTNVSYRQGRGEDLPLQDESVDLVTCSSSLHWFNIPAFFNEVKRVLRPGGVLACYWYRLPECHYGSHSFNDVVEEVWESWREYWPPCHQFIMKDDVHLPHLYPDQVTVRLSEKKFVLERACSLDDFVGFLHSTAVFQNLELDKGTQQAQHSLQALRQRLVSKMGRGNETDKVILKYYYALRMWRKPSH
ncbi:hypothetical protein Pmani_011942 [Petrolisthes manimaculis]|uniref:Methyltransferase type 11 domain-containing protein n=1 Tax=Petrolisthes manimaculis TaxID=1843537 RepID=A0AAE1PC53_9EUCA|nr:hypothetical protein Pmani_023314 [Petrolisthes manimaculis]KAK4316949.1 hypothetical protein Pmani_011942 [Petrolisthes manimaculis]